MSLPRLFYLILESASTYPYPVGTGCSTVEIKELDLSSCPDCDYNDSKLNAVSMKYLESFLSLIVRTNLKVALCSFCVFYVIYQLRLFVSTALQKNK